MKINLEEKLNLITEPYDPKIIATLNGQHLKLAKLKGSFTWHKHDEEDEAFLVIEGWFDMEFRDRTMRVNQGELIIVPKGVEHRPVAEIEASVLLFEPASTLNTGNKLNEFTKKDLDFI